MVFKFKPALNIIPVIILFAMIIVSCSSQKVNTFTKTLTFPVGATNNQKIEMASRLVPSSKQLSWQNLELTAFLHFGINTYTNREWGDGKESPRIFNPDSLDTDQWVRVLKEVGFKLVILTAKHHDGFCLWQTSTTNHSVASSPWRSGRGDVVADLRKACDKYNMKLGLYLSPWDRNAKCYGDSPAYNDMFVNQLTELLTNYGRVDEVWFDGACGEGPNGKKQEYDWTRFCKVIEELQPDAVIAIMGDDVRWVGNEKGLGRETEWSVSAMVPNIFQESDSVNKSLNLFSTAPDLGSREIITKADKLYWWPSEVDVSIRPGWFFHEKEQPKSLRQLAEIYINSVGRNSVLLMNIPPNKLGKISAYDVKRLKELRNWIDKNFSNNKLSKHNNFQGAIEKGEAINTVVLGEDISKGQRVEEFIIEAFLKGKWQTVANGTTIGYKRMLTFPQITPKNIRVKVLSSRGKVYLDKFEAYLIEMPVEIKIETPGYNKISTERWKVVDATGDATEASRAFDGDASTLWTSFSNHSAKLLTVDMGKAIPVAGFFYLPPSEGGDMSGTVFHYLLEFSNDKHQWIAAPLPGEFSNIMHNPIPQIQYFTEIINARYFRFTAIDEIKARQFVRIAEIGLLSPQK